MSVFGHEGVGREPREKNSVIKNVSFLSDILTVL